MPAQANCYAFDLVDGAGSKDSVHGYACIGGLYSAYPQMSWTLRRPERLLPYVDDIVRRADLVPANADVVTAGFENRFTIGMLWQLWRMWYEWGTAWYPADTEEMLTRKYDDPVVDFWYARLCHVACLCGHSLVWPRGHSILVHNAKAALCVLARTARYSEMGEESLHSAGAGNSTSGWIVDEGLRELIQGGFDRGTVDIFRNFGPSVREKMIKVQCMLDDPAIVAVLPGECRRVWKELVL
jgi:hypothetical protein